jgi:hypothetical protein
MLQAARGVGGFVFEVKADAVNGRQIQFNEMGI